MAIPIITGFDIANSTPADQKELVADATARLAIAYPFRGLVAHQEDTDQRYLYIGTPPSNTSGDWILKPTWIVGAIVPTTEGEDGDMWFNNTTNYLYEKVTGTWTLRADLTGSQFFAGAAAPTTEGVDGDIYFRHNGDVHQKVTGSWGSALYNTIGTNGVDGDTYAATSTTSVNIPTSHPTDVALTLDASTYDYSPGQSVIAAEDSTNYFIGIVKTYAASVLTITSSSNTGTGSAPTTAWAVNLNGAVGARGTAGKPGVADKTYTGAVSFVFNEAEITAIEGGSWDADNPYIAYILKDDRSNINAPAAIAGDQTGDIVTWDGTVWYDVGRVRGVDGSAGNAGWSPELGAVTRVQGAVTDVVLQLNAWKGGTGGVPAALTALVGYYVAGSGLVSDIALATNIKGDTGADGDTPNVENLELTTATKNMSRGNTKVPNPPTSYNISLNSLTPPIGGNYTWEMSNGHVATGYEQLYIKARVGYGIVKENQPTYGYIRLTLEGSLDGVFDTSGSYSNVLIETIQIPIYPGGAGDIEIRTAFGVPIAGNWFWRVRATSTHMMQYSQNTQVIYEVFKMNSDNQPLP